MDLVWFPFLVVILCHHATEAKNCTVAGRFPNDLSNDCRGYSMCLKVLNDFTRIDLVCPEHSIYSHIENQCTNITTYQCLPEYNCTQVGDFPNPHASECDSYISCAEGLGSMETARLTYCLPGMSYDPTEHACVNNTVFECVVTTSEPPKVFEVSIKFSPKPNLVNFSNNACGDKNQYVVFLSLIVYFRYIQYN